MHLIARGNFIRSCKFITTRAYVMAAKPNVFSSVALVPIDTLLKFRERKIREGGQLKLLIIPIIQFIVPRTSVPALSRAG